MIGSCTTFTESVTWLPACHSFERFHFVTITISVIISTVHSSISSLEILGHDGHLRDLFFRHDTAIRLNKSCTCYAACDKTFIEFRITARTTIIVSLNDKIVKI